MASSLAGGSVLGSACGSGSSSQPGSRGCSRCLWVQEKEDEMFTLIIEKNYFVWDMTFIFCFSPYQVLEIVVLTEFLEVKVSSNAHGTMQG